MKGRLFISALFLFTSLFLYGQVEFQTGNILFPIISDWDEIEVDQAEVEAMRSIEQTKDQPYCFAIPVATSLSPDNAGFILSNSDETVWILPIYSKGAKSLNVILSPFNLPDGAYIYVYDYDKLIVRGAFTNESCSGKNTLPVLPVPGEKLVIECHFPGKSISSEKIGVKQIAYDFAGFFGLEGIKDSYYGNSGSCEFDLNCFSDSDYQKSARSVVRMLIAGSYLCSGVLVNNTGTDYKAYVLTAYHCIETSDEAENTIFVFNYQSPWCNGPDIKNMHSLSGSVIRAENNDIDFTLLELDQFPPLVYKPYLSGWNITSVAPENTYTLHHPEGDVMKLSIDDNPPTIASYPVSGYVSNGFWRILKWDTGATEPGSSGGPLFDQDGRLRGTLTGGAATCTDPVNDYYARLSTMFSITSETTTSLLQWLDPASTGATIVGGRDPYEYNISLSDTLRNIGSSDQGTSDSYVSSEWGYSTGYNSDNLIRYAEYFDFSGTGEIAWVKMQIAAASYVSELDSVKISVFGNGSQPGTSIASKTYRIREAKDDYELEVDFGTTIKVTTPFYIGYTLYYKSPLSSDQPQFAVKHSEPWSDDSKNTAWFNDGISWKPFTEHPSFPMSTSLAIDVIMVENTTLNATENPEIIHTGLIVFPNPFTSSLSFYINDTAFVSTSLTLFDHTGRTVFAGQYSNIFPGVLTVELSDLFPGIYHYKLINDAVIFSGTLLKTGSK